VVGIGMVNNLLMINHDCTNLKQNIDLQQIKIKKSQSYFCDFFMLTKQTSINHTLYLSS